MNPKTTYDELLMKNSLLEAKNKELEREMKRLSGKDDKESIVEDSDTFLYEKILDNMAEGVVLVRLSDAIIIYTNSKFDEMFGYGKGELLNKHVSTIDAAGKKGADEIKSKLISGLLKDEIWKGEAQNIRKDGTTFWSKLNVSNFKHPKFGEVCIVIHENISDQKRTEEMLKDSEEKFRLISEQSMLGILIIQDNIVKYANNAASLITELSVDEIHRMNSKEFYNWVHSDDRAMVKEQSGKKQRGEKEVRVSYEFRLITKTKKVKWIEIYSKTISYEGKPANLITMIDITAGKKVEEDLKSSEEKFRLISEQSMLGILIIQDNIVKYINQAAVKISDVSADEIYNFKSEKMYEAIHPDDMEFVVNQARKKQAGEKDVVTNYTFRIITKTKKLKWIELYSKTISYEGRPADLITMIDITTNKQIEEDLKNSEKKFRNLFYNAQVGIFRSSIDGNKFLDLNDKMTEILGYKRKELIKLNPVDLWIHPQQRKEMMNILNNKGSVSDYEILVKSKSGNIITLILSVKLYQEFGYIEGSVLDITDRKRAEEELEKSEDMYRTLIRTSPDAIVLSDLEGKVTYASPPALRLMRADNTKNLVGTPLFDSLAPEERSKGEATLKKILEKGFANNIIIKYQRLDGSNFYGETNASLLKDPKGNSYAIIASTRDITKRINDEKELLEAKERAIESDLLKSAFLANMSHEIRTPMNGIVGFADLVKNRAITTAKRNKYLDIIIDRSKHLLNIINDIIDISKIEAGEINIIEKEFNLNKMLNKLYSFFESEIQIKSFRNVELRINSGLEDKKSIIYTDPVRLQQILTNLISNAFKFTKKGHIEYGYTVSDEKTLNFYVKDTGIGLSKEEQEIIFDRFRQGENSGEELIQGTGLGLSISKGLIEFLDGRIWVKSKKGSGSTFYFNIPYKTLQKTKLKIKGKKEEVNNKHILENKTILIVEDDDTSFYFFKEILAETNAKLLWVKEGTEAIELCQNNPDIDLVLMDIQLPYMNGYDATQEIKKYRQDLPVIAETAYALAGEKEKAINAGCDDYLSKPIDKEILLKKIKKLLKR
ncbi:MAG: PAS domain S-box protein [Bacteroidales bacterium]|nr:MAG: PAS domain S-box protein [Bacteroidales bacterium]